MMFVKNKKFVLGLLLLTIIGGILLPSRQRVESNFAPKEEIVKFSQDFNKSLPIKITNDITLIKTQLGNVTPTLYSLDFFYAYYKNKADITNFDALTTSMIYQTCQDQTMLSLLKRHVLLKHQFITLDKEKLPYIGVSFQDCEQLKTPNSIVKEKQKTN